MPTLHDVLYGSSRPDSDHDDPPNDEAAPAGPPPLPARARVVPWCDPVVDLRGHDPRSTYVEQFWLSVLGPSAVWTMRLFAAGFDDHPDGYELDVADAARTLGLSAAKGAASPFGRAVQRCVMFGMATARSDGWAVRRRMPPVTARHLQRLPDSVRTRHDAWTRTTLRLDELERAHTLGAAMLAAGDDPGLLAPQLMAVGVSPAAAEEARRLVIATRTGPADADPPVAG